jgi:hypothetical protein
MGNITSSKQVDIPYESMGVMSPRKMNDESDTGVDDDWGIAFEGLSLDTKLYPTVGLYQRDD